VTVELFSNLPQTTVTSGGTTAPSGGTVENWTVASSSSFPAASATAVPPTQFHVSDIAGDTEIIAVTNVSGTTWHVTRGAEGTTPVAHTAGFTVKQVVTSGWLNTIPAENAAGVQYVYTSGDTTGALDTAAINAAILAAPPGGIVYLAAGIYYTNAPIVIGSRVVIMGPDSAFNWGSYNGGYPNSLPTPTGFSSTEALPPSGAVIRPVAAWAQGGAVAAAVLLFISPSHYITEGPILKNLCIDGVNLVATADGIMGYGAVADVQMTNVYVMRCTGWGINTASDPSAPGGYTINTPGTWKVNHCETWLNNAGGINLVFVADSDWVDVLCEGNNGDGWALLNTDNSHFIGCRAEWSNGHGFHVTGAWLSAAGYGCPQTTFTGCTTDANFKHGFFVDATTGTATINVVGCNFHRDGNNGTPASWAGMAISQTAAGNLHMQVIARGVMVTATTAAHGVGPAYGLYLNGTGCNLDIDGARLIGNTGAVSLTGVPARLQVGPGMSYATGDSSGPTTVVPANWKAGTATLTAGTVTVSNTSVTANSQIQLAGQTPGGTPGALYVSAVTAATSFTVKSTSGTDTSTFAYRMNEPG
jgi:Right handed beta helix region